MQHKPLPDRIAWALACILVFTLPMEKAVQVPGLGTISRTVGLLAFAAAVIVVARRRGIRAPNAALLLAAAFVLWSGLTHLWSLSPQATAARFATFAQLFGLLWLIWELCRTAAAQSQLMYAYAGGAAVSSVLTILRAAQNQQTYYRRFATAGFDPNDLGVTLALAIPLALYLAHRARGWTAWVARAAAVLIIVAILLTASRTALVAACLGFAYAALTWSSASSPQRISSAALLALLLLGAIRLAPAASRERLSTLPTEISRGTFHNRTRIWKTGLKVLKRHPISGAGSGAYPEAVRPWLGTPPVPGHEYAAHNTFLSVLVETGAIGFALFGLLLATLVFFAWVTAGVPRVLWLTMLAVWATGVSTLTWEHRKPTWLLFALIMTAWARTYEDREPQA